MDKRLRKYYYAGTLNLLLWLPLLSLVFLHGLSSDPDRQYLILFIVGSGVLLATLIQHWVYYDIYNPKTRLTTVTPDARKG